MLETFDFKLEFKAAAGSDKPPGYFEGIGSTPALDQSKDIIASGAFGESIAKKGVNGIKFLRQHNARDTAGKWLSIEQRGDVLFATGQLNLDPMHPVGPGLYAQMKAGEVDGLSVGFTTIERSWNEETNVRTILKADLWEISAVTFACNLQCGVSMIKGIGPEMRFSIDEGEGPAEIARKFMDHYELPRRQADACVDALKAIARSDPEFAALKAAFSGKPKPTEPTAPTVNQPAPEASKALADMLARLRDAAKP